MNLRLLSILAAWSLAGAFAWAFPPAPYYTLYGTVRDEHGTPFLAGGATVVLSGQSGEIVRAPVDTSIAPGVNYTLHIPMDAGTLAALYTPTAMRPTMPYTVKVVVNGVDYLPIQIVGQHKTIGKPGEQVRLDLTLGVDSDHDGLPDAWEWDLINQDPNDGLRTLADIRPGDDLDGDGLTNLQEYLAGTYALDRLDGVSIQVVGVADGVAHLRFLSITGRSYAIRSSSDGKAWQDQTFSLSSDVSSPSASYRAADVRTIDAYVKWSGARGFFQLFAQ